MDDVIVIVIVVAAAVFVAERLWAQASGKTGCFRCTSRKDTCGEGKDEPDAE